MSRTFGFTTTTDEVLDGISLTGKRVLITGVSAGLGVETARALVAKGAEVTGTARNLAKATEATAAIRKAAQSGPGSLTVIPLDLADLSSVSACAETLTTQAHPFDIVIANAGVMAMPYQLTPDGVEMQSGTNWLGHFALLRGIMPLLHAGSRIVILSSAAHHISDIDLDDMNFEQTPYDKWIAYGRSKTACALLAVELDRRYRSEGIRATAVHPGGIQTELQRHYPAEEEKALVDSINAANAASGQPPFQYKTVAQGAATSVWAAVVADADEVGGRYCEDCHVADTDDSDGIHGGVRSYAVSPERAQALWEKGESILKNRG